MESKTLYPLRLPASFREKIWGSRDPAPIFGPQPKPIGEAIAVTKQDPHRGPMPAFRFPVAQGCRELLAACRYFVVERLEWRGDFHYEPDPGHADLLVFLRGRGRIGDDEYARGGAYLIPAEAPLFKIQAVASTEVIRGYVPDMAALQGELRSAGMPPERMEGLLFE